MPAYTYVCPSGHTTEHLRPMAQRNEPQSCESCGAITHRQLDWRVAHRIGKDGLLAVPGYPRDTLGRRQPVKNAKSFGV